MLVPYATSWKQKSKDGMGAKGLIGGGERAGTWRERRRQTDTGKRTRAAKKSSPIWGKKVPFPAPRIGG